MKVFVSLDTKAYCEKPKGNMIPVIRHRCALNWQQIELDELADMVGNKGYTMVPARLEGGLKAENFTAIQLFTLDFDHGSTFAEIRDKCERLGIPISFAYHTFSSSEKEERFRVVFVYECLIEEAFVARAIQEILSRIFLECDHQCHNIDRMFFGGNELIYFNRGARMTLVQLIFPLMEALNVGGHYQRNIQRFSAKTNIMLFNDRPVMGRLTDLDLFSGEKLDPAIIYIIGESTNSPNFIAKTNSLHSSLTCDRKKKRLEVKEAKSGCLLLSDFESGNEMDHEAKFAILTNLLYVYGGKSHFLEVIREFYGEESFEKWKKDMGYVSGYHPKRCSVDFCPYYGSCEQAGTIIDTLALDRTVHVVTEEKYYSLETVQMCLENNLNSALHSRKLGMHLIKAQTAIGKTTAYINMIVNNPDTKFLIAVPTNILKDQVMKDLKGAGLMEKEIFVTISVSGNSFFSEELQVQISDAHTQGIHNKTKDIVNARCKEAQDAGASAVVEECKKIVDGINAIQDERVVVTTHAYFLQMSEDFLKQYTIIIDEDILQLQMFNLIYTISADCLNELVEKKVLVYSDIAKELLRAEENEYKKINCSLRGYPLSEEQLQELECFGNGDNINDLLYAKAFVKLEDKVSGQQVIKYFCPPKLHKLKYIVLSATLNENIYQKYFQGHMDIYMYPEKKAKYKGKLIQYTYHSLGRKDLSNKIQVFSFVQKIAGLPDLPIITFKKNCMLKNMPYTNSQNMHYGNTTGINALSGKDIGIIGTPYKVEESYKLIACYLGADVNQKQDQKPRMRRINYKNYNFLIVTYQEPLLREVQLYSIESELEQCIGRARLLRKDCTVYLFSAFPCEQAELRQRNYLIE